VQDLRRFPMSIRRFGLGPIQMMTLSYFVSCVCLHTVVLRQELDEQEVRLLLILLKFREERLADTQFPDHERLRPVCSSASRVLFPLHVA
jgi:hypothetical protein